MLNVRNKSSKKLYIFHFEDITIGMKYITLIQFRAVSLILSNIFDNIYL